MFALYIMLIINQLREWSRGLYICNILKINALMTNKGHNYVTAFFNVYNLSKRIIFILQKTISYAFHILFILKRFYVLVVFFCSRLSIWRWRSSARW